jgi:hypothetical protein
MTCHEQRALQVGSQLPQPVLLEWAKTGKLRWPAAAQKTSAATQSICPVAACLPPRFFPAPQTGWRALGFTALDETRSVARVGAKPSKTAPLLSAQLKTTTYSAGWEEEPTGGTILKLADLFPEDCSFPLLSMLPLHVSKRALRGKPLSNLTPKKKKEIYLTNYSRSFFFPQARNTTTANNIF